MRTLARMLGVAALTALCATALAACGNDNKKGSGQPGGAEVKPVDGQKKGGTLQVESAEGFQHLDPGASYFQGDYEVVYAAHRPLFSFKPDDPDHVSPDLAAEPAKVSSDAKTVTIRIRRGVKFSPPVNREVTSRDVKFAIERGFNPTVANPYAGSYFGTLEGAENAKGGPISGISTPDEQTIVLKFTKPFAATAAQALSLPLSSPVPKEYVDKLKADSKTPSLYDSDPTKQAFTGPYVIKSYSPGKSLELARNPNWDPETDYRPAYLDAVRWQIGTDPNVSGRKVLAGKRLITGDIPSAPVVKLAVQKYRDQISFTLAGNRYIAMNTTLPPFDDVNVRRAVVAATDRRALQLTRGGKVAGEIATHFMAPNAPGFEAAGGAKGNHDFLENPSGDMGLAAKYMKAAGFSSGKYSGPEITMVGDNDDPSSKTAQVALQTFQKLGFKVRFRSVQHETMLSKCGLPKEKVHVCPNLGWLPDFPDGYAWLYVPFDGQAIAPVNNANVSQLDDARVNDAIDRAAAISDPAKRAEAWGKVDDLITSLAPAVPWFWDTQPNIQSADVQGVIAQWNAAYDLSFTSLK